MARKLPWERSGPRSRPSASAHRRSFSPGPSAPPPDGEDRRRKRPRASSPSRTSRADAVAQRFRTPSTSPPPVPPSESFMVGGMDNDDQYRMVEDELLAVAQTFTAHLHAAEYQRLKARAKSQTAAALRSIARPVTGGPTDRVRKRAETARRVDKQQRGLRKAFASGGEGGDDDDGDDDAGAPWTGTSLQNLMEGSPRKEASLFPLTSLTGKAAVADTGDDKDDEDEDGDDDLDRPPAHKRSEVASKPPLQPAFRPQQLPPRPRDITKKTTSTVTSPPAKRTVSFAPTPRVLPVISDDNEGGDDDDAEDDDDLSDDLDGGQLLQKLRKRREREKAERQKRQQQQQQERRRRDAGTAHARETNAEAGGSKPTSLDIIPSFL